jgi:hypothetical protein
MGLVGGGGGLAEAIAITESGLAGLSVAITLKKIQKYQFIQRLTVI